MLRAIQVANIQLDVRPGPVDARLYRADQLISDAAQAGAELVVLPELFNTGYAYRDENYRLAEPEDGGTVTWMKRAARRHHVHLAGSLLLRDGGEIYNAMFIAAPGGQTWRNDKCYPWAWEHAYFRPSRRQGADRAVVAHTDLGDLGMLICWDAAHIELWQAYAGQVDMMVICSSPPMVTEGRFTFSSGAVVPAERLSFLTRHVRGDDRRAFGEMLDEQAAWLQVPAASCMPCGMFASPLPTWPGFARLFLPTQVEAPMVEENKIISADGKSLMRCASAQGECFITTEVQLAAQKPQPQGSQPASRLSPAAYHFSDTLIRRVTQPLYRRGVTVD